MLSECALRVLQFVFGEEAFRGIMPSCRYKVTF